MARKKKKKKKYRGFWIFVRIQLLLMIIVLGALAYYYYGGYAKEIKNLQNEALKKVHQSSEATFCAAQTGIVYDCNKQVIATLSGEKDVYYLKYE